MLERNKIPILLFLVALIPRLLYFQQYVESPYFGSVFLDELYHFNWGQAIAHGQLAGDTPFFRAPLYCYLLGALWSAFPDSSNLLLIVPRLLQLCLGAFATVLLFIYADRVFGRRAAYISWLLVAVHGTAIYFENELLDIFLQLLFFPAILLAALSYIQRPSWKPAAWLGLCFGLCAIARPNILLFGPLMVAVIAIYAPRPWPFWRYFRQGLVFAAFTALCILPATLHNYLADGTFVPIATYGGVNFWLGNKPAADGNTPMTSAQYFAHDRYRDSVEMFGQYRAEELEGREMTPAEVSRFWMRRTLKSMRDEPLANARRFGAKLFSFWNDQEVKNNKNVYFVSNYIPFLKFLLAFTRWGVVAALGLVGMGLAFRRRPSPGAALAAALLFTFMVSAVLYFVSDRHRLPALPLLALFAGHAVDRMIGFMSGRRWKALAASLLVLAAALAAAMPRWRGDLNARWLARDWWTLGNCYQEHASYDPAGSAAQAENLAKAEKAYDTGLKYDPDDANIWNNLGEVFFARGDLEGARQKFADALKADPHYMPALNNAGVVFKEAGDLDRAEQCFETIRKESPDYALVDFQLGDVRLRQKRWEEALAFFDVAVGRMPNHVPSCLGRAKALLELGRTDEARASLEKGLAIGGERARGQLGDFGLDDAPERGM